MAKSMKNKSGGPEEARQSKLEKKAVSSKGRGKQKKGSNDVAAKGKTKNVMCF